MVARITDFSEYNARIADDDWMEVSSNGIPYKVSPSKKVSALAGYERPNPTGSSTHYSIPGGLWGYSVAGTSEMVQTTAIYFQGKFRTAAPIVINSMMVYVSTAQAASVLRVGIHSANDDWSLKALVTDFGTFDSSTTGRKELTGLSLSLPPGMYYSSLAASVANVAVLSPGTNPFSPEGAIVNGTAIAAASLYFMHLSQTATTPAISGFPAVSASAMAQVQQDANYWNEGGVFYQWTEA